MLMKFMIKGLLFGAAILSLSATECIMVSAASIDKIRIRLQADDFDEMERPILDAESMDEAYVITGIERISDEFLHGPASETIQMEDDTKTEEWSKDDTGTKEQVQSEDDMKESDTVTELSYEIELESDGGDTFSIMNQSDIKFSGLKAVCSKAVRKDNGEKLLLTIELEDTGELIGTIDKVYWEGNNIGRWGRAPGADAYLVMLYCNEKRVGHPHRTSAEQYDFSPLMSKAGIYYFKVFPLAKQRKRGKPVESSWKTLAESDAVQNKIRWSEKKPGWQSDEEIPSYILKDGTYPQMDVVFINEEWYQFNERGEIRSILEVGSERLQ